MRGLFNLWIRQGLWINHHPKAVSDSVSGKRASGGSVCKEQYSGPKLHAALTATMPQSEVAAWPTSQKEDKDIQLV